MGFHGHLKEHGILGYKRPHDFFDFIVSFTEGSEAAHFGNAFTNISAALSGRKRVGAFLASSIAERTPSLDKESRGTGFLGGSDILTNPCV